MKWAMCVLGMSQIEAEVREEHLNEWPEFPKGDGRQENTHLRSFMNFK